MRPILDFMFDSFKWYRRFIGGIWIVDKDGKSKCVMEIYDDPTDDWICDDYMPEATEAKDGN